MENHIFEQCHANGIDFLRIFHVYSSFGLLILTINDTSLGFSFWTCVHHFANKYENISDQHKTIDYTGSERAIHADVVLFFMFKSIIFLEILKIFPGVQNMYHPSLAVIEI